MSKWRKTAFVLWFTGLPKSGKTTIADGVYHRIKTKVSTERLDGDLLRQLVSSDLGFTPTDRDKNIKRATYIAEILTRHNVSVIASFVSPYQRHRNYPRSRLKNFIEIYVNTPLSVCEKRDHTGIYKQARSGTLLHFTGISDVYEKPLKADITLPAHKLPIAQCVETVVNYIKAKGFLA